MEVLLVEMETDLIEEQDPLMLTSEGKMHLNLKAFSPSYFPIGFQLELLISRLRNRFRK